MALEDHAAAALANQRQKAGELNGISQRLVGVNQDRLPRQRRAEPAWLMKRTGLKAGLGPALFIMRPTGGEISLEKMEESAIES